MNIQNYLLLFNIGLALFIAIVSARRVKVANTIHLAILAFVVAFWSLIHLLFNLQLFHFPKLWLIALVYLCTTVSGSLLLMFSLAYSNRPNWSTPTTISLLAIEPLITQILFWIKPTRDLFFWETTNSISYISFTSGPWAVINAIYLYNFEIASLLLLTDIFTKKPRTLFLQSGTLLAGVFIPFIFRTVEMVSHTSPGLSDNSIAGYSMCIIGLAFGLHRNSVVETEPVTRETIVRSMNDGWMILDLKSNIIDVNPAAEKIVGIPSHYLYGKPIRSVLPDWPDISNIADEGKELEMRRSFRASGSWRYLNVRLSKLRNRNGDPFAQLIIWRDITERKQAEEARQRARDEMFVLLNAISNAASHSIKLEEFLSESIYQLIYPFQSQVIALFLINENDKAYQHQQLQLTAHFGLTPDDQKNLDTTPIQSRIFTDVMTSKQPLAIENAGDDPRVHPVFKQLAGLVVLPLYTQAGESSRFLGLMLLGRKDIPAYSQDEVIRLSTIAEQIANLIDSDRRRQLAIALSEREKLMRDLHDSVSQKLYGLVTLTEAAQAGLEAGSKVIPSQVLAKIGENARQAVKEMRLFLYQMQPVDLEKGDLVAALHHRLGAVEGRADIQARFLPDDGIYISKEREVALYYIAQEALNNILKHARANLVLVKLKQTRQNIILEVTDNGEGFEPKKADHNGMGLQNMQARTAQIKGKLKIISKPGAGTTIRIVVGREKISNQSRNR
jgi:PAS domain S-box-containing protein